MLTTVAWMLGDQVSYALEGSTFIAGAAIQWLRDGLKIIQSSAQSEDMALSVPDTGGVIFVPAFVGLGAPHWNPHARGIITGITRGTTAAHLARAALEGIAFQIADLIAAMEGDFGKKISVLRVDGGAAANNLLMQFQSNILNRNLVRPKQIETTVLGAAFLAGLGAGVWRDPQDIAASWHEDQKFTPHMKNSERLKRLSEWRAAVKKA
jgi:glycerol kinase